MAGILVIDGEKSRNGSLETILRFLGYEYESGEEGDCLALLDTLSSLFAVILGSFSGKPEELLAKYPNTPFVLIEDESHPRMQEPLPNLIGYLKEPFDIDTLTELLHFCQSFHSLHRKVKESGDAVPLMHMLIGQGEKIQQVRHLIEQVASRPANVLILGESGTGKEVVARAVHALSPRKNGPFVPINCGAIPGELLESELFGHEKGAYTGSVGESEGYFGIANKGTIFLDEVGELPMATQARLLRVLETGEYIRVGGTEIRKTDVRIVAATNVNMQKAISEGRFREDLYYRLNTIPIQMPPLRERGQDIILLFRLFAMQMAEKYRLPKVTLSEEAKQIMLNYKWPGNVRQLKNITEQMSILSPEREIGRETLLQYIPQDKESMQLAVINNNSEHSYESEREILYKILYELRGNVSDLRRELNNVRRQMEEVRDLNGAAAFSPAPHPSAIAPINTTAITPHPSSNTQQNDFAIAEEISEPENLNLSEVGKQVLLKALERNNGNRKKAAKELGISDRTLYRKLKLYNLEDETAKD